MKSTRVVPFRQRTLPSGVPAGDTKQAARRSDDSRRSRAVRFFRDIHGTERIWRRVPVLEDICAGDDHTPIFGLVVCTTCRGANAR